MASIETGAGRRIVSRGELGLLLLIAVSTPTALWAESIFRRLMPPELDEFRAWLRPEATAAAWVLAGLAVATSFLALAIQRRLFLRALAGQRRGDENYRLRHARIQTIALGSSIPQVPALCATAAHMFGAEIGATLAAIGVATLGVAIQGFGLLRGGALDVTRPAAGISPEA